MLSLPHQAKPNFNCCLLFLFIFLSSPSSFSRVSRDESGRAHWNGRHSASSNAYHSFCVVHSFDSGTCSMGIFLPTPAPKPRSAFRFLLHLRFFYSLPHFLLLLSPATPTRPAPRPSHLPPLLNQSGPCYVIIIHSLDVKHFVQNLLN